MRETIDWAEFCAERAAQRDAAQRAIGALCTGHQEPVIELLKPWFPAESPSVTQLSCRALLDARPAPNAAALARLHPDPAAPRPPASAFEHLCAAVDAPAARLGDDPLVWAVTELTALGQRLAAIERGWTARDAEADASAIGCWLALAHGSPFLDPAAWRRHFETPAMEVLSGVCADAKLSDARRRGVLAEERDNLMLVLAERRDGLAGWRDVAMRAVEQDPRGPLVALSAALGPNHRVGAARCLASRGAWAETLAQLWPAPSADDRVAACAGLLAERPAALEDLAGAHTIRRLFSRWSAGFCHPRASWSTVRANRCSLRGRLRAMLAVLPTEALLPALLGAPGVAERTARAVRRFALARAWQQARRGFPGDCDNVTVPCAEPSRAIAPLPDAAFFVLRAWVLLVVLRGRLAQLEDWLDPRIASDSDAVWGRLLTTELPPSLREPPDARPHQRLRAALSLSLYEQLDELAPSLEALAALPPGRALPGLFRDTIAPMWSLELPKLQRGFERMQAHARAALAGRPLAGEDRWTR